MIIAFVLLFFMILFCLLYENYKTYNQTYNQTSNHIKNDTNKPYLFTYWEFKKDVTRRPGYINLCFETIKKNGNLFNVQILDDKSVLKFLPNLRKDINLLPLALKADYIRVCLLYYYGGMWLDADVIMMSDMHQVIDLLNNGEDFIGFGCTGKHCNYGYGEPSNWAMASKKEGILMKCCMDELNKKLDEYYTQNSEERKEFNYFELGKFIIWSQLKLLQKTQYKYYHFPSNVDGTRDNQNNWIAPDVIFKKDFDIDLDKLMIMVLANSYYCNKKQEYNKYNWFCGLSEDQVMKGNYFISKVFNKVLRP